MWPFKSKASAPLPKGELQVDLAAMNFDDGNIALMFEIPDENESRYWVVNDPQVILTIAEAPVGTDPPRFFSALNRVVDPDPQMPELVWLLEGREFQGAYNFGANSNFTQNDAEQFIMMLGPKANRVEWFEPYLRGRSEIEAMQERLWAEDDIFSLSALPDITDFHHDFTHATRLRLPPTDDAPAARMNISSLLQQAFPRSDDLYFIDRLYFAPLNAPAAIAVRGPKDLNATKHKKVSAPSTPIFQPEAWLYCEQAFYDHANRSIADLIPPMSLLSDAYQLEVAKIAEAAIAD